MQINSQAIICYFSLVEKNVIKKTCSLFRQHPTLSCRHPYYSSKFMERLFFRPFLKINLAKLYALNNTLPAEMVTLCQADCNTRQHSEVGHSLFFVVRDIMQVIPIYLPSIFFSYKRCVGNTSGILNALASNTPN